MSIAARFRRNEALFDWPAISHFFPQLVAGPIVRAGAFLYQFDRRRRWHAKVFFEGAYLIVRGLFLKLVVADNLGRIVDERWAVGAAEPHGLLAFSLLFFFACQLLCDFAGYSDIARGVAYQLGFRLPVNFNAPYIARSFAGFWRRWHISLSEWMRDYVYVSLGGNREGWGRLALNLLLVMLISGLWHGAKLDICSLGRRAGRRTTDRKNLRNGHRAVSPGGTCLVCSGPADVDSEHGILPVTVHW